MRLVLCSLVLLLGGLQLTSALRVGAWNIERFGPSKLKKTTVMKQITTIVQRYDIIVIQELQDTKPGFPVINTLMHLLNQGGYQFNYKVSAPLGPSTYKEEYLFVYKINSVTLVNYGQYPDSKHFFTRPPFVAEFSDNLGHVGNFVLIPQHTSPPSAVQEIDGLVDVFHSQAIQNMLILGDFNAAPPYVNNKTDWSKIRLFTNKIDFHWLILDTDDTTVAGRNRAYDRIVATTSMMNYVAPGTAQVYNFTAALGLVNQKQAAAISYSRAGGGVYLSNIIEFPVYHFPRCSAQAHRVLTYFLGVARNTVNGVAMAISNHFPVEVELY